jgi:3D (Asp-Asp-Asp) domain-containing protein
MLAEFLLTAYAVSCDVPRNHPTKSGVLPQVGWTVAADPKVLPIGSIIHIEGYGERMVQDIGGKIKGKRLDIFVENCKVARKVNHKVKIKVLHIGGKK